MKLASFSAWFAAALAVAPLSVQAQSVDGVPGVTVKIWGVAVGSNGNASGSISVSLNGLYGEQTSSNDQPLSGQNGTQTIASTPATLQLQPGVVYNGMIDQYWETNPNLPSPTIVSDTIDVVAPPGYAIYINNLPQSSFQIPNVSGASQYDGAFTVCVVGPGQFTGRAGTCTSLIGGQVYWQMALGHLQNGASAGSLVLADVGTESTWTNEFTTADLYYQAPSGEIVPTTDSNGHLTQILADEAAVKIVTQSSNSYEIECYNPSQVSGDAQSGYTYTGTPYVVYAVSQVGSENELQIESMTYSDADLSGSETTPVRTAVTTLALSGSGTSGDPYVWTLDDWHDASASTVRQETRTWGSGGGSETRVVTAPNGGEVTTVSKTLTQYLWGEELTQLTRGTGSTAISTAMTHYTDSTQPGSYGMLETSATAGGTWTAYDYYNDLSSNEVGVVNHVYRPFGDSPAAPTEDASDGTVTAYAYTADVFGMPTRPTSIVTTVNNQTTASASISYSEVTIPTGSGSTPIVVATREDTPTSGGTTLTTTTEYYREDTADLFYRNQLYAVSKPSGLEQCYVYARGSFSTAGDPSTFTASTTYPLSATTSAAATEVTVITGSDSPAVGTGVNTYAGADIANIWLINGKATAQSTIRNADAQIVRTETWVWVDGSWQLAAWTDFSYDGAGLLASRTSSNGATHTWAYGGEQLQSETDESGATTTYTYDAGGRLLTATKADGMKVTYGYDADGRPVSRALSGSGTSDTLLTSWTYDDAGRCLSETDPGLDAVDYSYDSTGLNRTTTYAANGGTKVEDNDLDGRIASVTGTAVYPTYYTYSIDGTTGDLLTETDVGADQSSQSRWTKVWTDWLGRTVQKERPVLGQSTPYTEVDSYDPTLGLLTEVTRTGYAPERYQYDTMGNGVLSGLDLGGGLAPASNDRITGTVRYVEELSGTLWLHDETDSYPYGTSSPNNADAFAVSITRTRLTNFAASQLAETQTTDAYGNVSDCSVTDSGSGTVVATTKVTTAAGGTPFQSSEVKTFTDGLLVSDKGLDGLTQRAGYDGLERRTSVTDSRGNITTMGYQTGTTFVASVTEPTPAYPNGVQVAGYTYDGFGNVGTAQDATGASITYTYNLQNQLGEKSGTGTLPVKFGYDMYGDQNTMSTYRSGLSGAADTTTWNYDGPSGLLASKTDATGTASAQYTYNSRGQVATRIWARGVTTTYSYYGDSASDPDTGDPKGITYSDGVTAAVAYQYTRAGQLAAVSDATNATAGDQRQFVYDPAQPFQLDRVDLGSFYNERVLTRQYDVDGVLPGRPAGFELGNVNTANADLEQSYYFNAQGWLDHITSTSAAGNNSTTFQYSYPGNAALVSAVAVTASPYPGGSPFTETRGYEPTRDLLTGLTTTWGTSAPVAQFGYTYNAKGQREYAQQSGTAYQDYYAPNTSYSAVYNAFTYDSTGELVQTAMYRNNAPTGGNAPPSGDALPGRSFNYFYDQAGNRVQAGPSTSQNSAVNDVYVANNLDQYNGGSGVGAKTVAGYRILGNAQVGTSVSSASATLGMLDRNYGGFAVAPQNSPATYASATVTGTIASSEGGDVSLSASHNFLLPPNPQVFAFDADGNLTSDGVWSYQYDGENRLIQMQNLVGEIGGTPYQINFVYDYLGRRAEKRVYQTPSAAQQGQPSLDRRYIYDGWNLVAETDAAGNLLRAYVWGLDLAGKVDSTGGVGALLSLSNFTGGSLAGMYFAGSDGNGNVAVLVNANGGALAAAYEYTAFGVPLRTEDFDSAVGDNPFRYASHYTDGETGLVNYGDRFYAPALGRFINRDPTGEAGGANLYACCGNDPVNGWDALGDEAVPGSTLLGGSPWAPGEGQMGEFGADSTAGGGDDEYVQLAAPQPGVEIPIYEFEAYDNGQPVGTFSQDIWGNLVSVSPAVAKLAMAAGVLPGGVASSGLASAASSAGSAESALSPTTGSHPDNNSAGPAILLPPVYVGVTQGSDLEAAIYWAGLNQLMPYLSPSTPGYYIARGAVSAPNNVLAQAMASGASGMTLANYQALATQLGWTGFTTNLSQSQQLYYGATAANILALQTQGRDMSQQWAAVLSEVPGVITDSNGNMASSSADTARGSFLSSMGGYTSLVAAGVIFPSASQLASMLGTDDIHPVKSEILQDLNDPSILGTNPDIGIDDAGNIVLRSRLTGKTISTGVPLEGYGPGDGLP